MQEPIAGAGRGGGRWLSGGGGQTDSTLRIWLGTQLLLGCTWSFVLALLSSPLGHSFIDKAANLSHGNITGKCQMPCVIELWPEP